ncbi:putative GIY-YIG superfamily endonuclease [Microbacterium resistens]|uniref:GIY-YIG superfamily endonuclease n=1 Tax=Microbacterium resistens TaxID=156977 RepID=A0ABU1SD33_9MICO|nr:GIY-YIG nuclease family protein [Microbacterium resistens]MDR6867515.1 putative GIY-YIG superfamily endonuclease [Microbacterium resistens]
MTDLFAVYRLFSSADVLLYVGATKNVRTRMYQHRADRPWWGEVDETLTTLKWFETVEDAAQAEFDAIRRERPVHNVASTEGRHPQMYRVPSGRRGPRRARVIAMAPDGAGDELMAAQAELEALEAELRRERSARNHALRAALASGVTWKRAGRGHRPLPARHPDLDQGIRLALLVVVE